MTSSCSLLAAIEQQRERVIDLDIAVDDARRVIDRDLVDLRAKGVERDRAAVHLQHLIEWARTGAAADDV